MRGIDESIAYGLAAAAFGLVCLGIAAVVRKIRTAATIAALPQPAERGEHLAHVRALRKEGASLKECVAALRRRGLKAGVAQSLVLDMEREQPADVAHPMEADWRGYRFRYPGNWRMETLVPELGPDAAISIDGVGAAMVMFVALDGEKGPLEEMLAEQEGQIRDAERAPEDDWGGLRGEGTRIRGVHAKMHLPMELLILRTTETPFPFVVMEWHALEEAHLVEPGFALIRDSFALA